MKIRRIQSSLIRAFALIVILTIFLLATVSLNFLRKTLMDTAEQSTMQFASQLSRIVDNYITYMNDIALVVMEDVDVRAYMEAPAASAQRDRSRIAQFLSSIRNVRKDIDGVFLLPAGSTKEVMPAYVIASSPGAEEDAINVEWSTERMREMEHLSSGIQLADENLGRRPARFVSDENLRRLALELFQIYHRRESAGMPAQ